MALLTNMELAFPAGNSILILKFKKYIIGIAMKFSKK